MLNKRKILTPSAKAAIDKNSPKLNLLDIV